MGERKLNFDEFLEIPNSLKDGDFIFGKIGTLGKPFKLPLNLEYTLSANVILVQPISLYLIKNWLFNFMKSPFINGVLAKDSRATSQAAFGIKKIRLIPVPVPPLEEQKEIVHQIKLLFKVADTIEQQYQQTKGAINQLDQSILAQAFRGALVPQDPNDEPASVLLERIRAEREKSTGATSKRSKKSADTSPSQNNKNAGATSRTQQ